MLRFSRLGGPVVVLVWYAMADTVPLEFLSSIRALMLPLTTLPDVCIKTNVRNEAKIVFCSKSGTLSFMFSATTRRREVFGNRDHR
jgi:hypothetical protein